MNHSKLRTAVLIVGLANFAYFFVEFFVARRIGSVSLFADSVDFLEDAAVNFLILLALGWSLKLRSRVGMLLALILFIPAISCVWTAWTKFLHPVSPDPRQLLLTGAGALFINVGSAFLLANYRDHGGSLTRAAFLSARNDAIANLAIIAAGLISLRWISGWPDLIVGLGIMTMNLDAARAVWKAAWDEHLSEKARDR